MITAIVTFGLPAGMTRDTWLSIIEPASARFQTIPGLIRKQFLFSDNLHGEVTGGGVYLWESRAQAEACFNGPWRESIARVATGAPQIVYFDTQVVVDNAAGDIKVAA